MIRKKLFWSFKRKKMEKDERKHFFCKIRRKKRIARNVTVYPTRNKKL